MIRVIQGDCVEELRKLAAESVQCCVTSPPYWGQRNYQVEGQYGQEPTPELFVERLVEVFREVRRALKSDGTLWINLGDSYCSQGGSHDDRDDNQPGVGAKRAWRDGSGRADGIVDARGQRNRNGNSVRGLKAKDLVGIPWMVAFALRADGWYLRQDIIWSKPNPMPESVTDRCTKAHEYLFMLSKSRSYFYDTAAIRNPASDALIQQVEDGYGGSDTKQYQNGDAQSASGTKSRIIEGARQKIDKQRGHTRRHAGFNDRWDQLTREEQMILGSNKRSVWTVATKPFPDAHFATYPPDLIKPCILAGSKPGDIILDPFGGSGTTGMVALELGRKAVLIELNEEYVKLIEKRCSVTMGLGL